MRGKIAVVVIVLLACALFLVPYASAKVDIDCSVYPEKAGYNTDFVYSITLTNSGTFITLGNLKLIVGSDSDITREWEVGDLELVPGSECKIEYGKLRIPAGKSCTVKKRVQFTHHKLYQGAFKEWADAEKPDPPEWHKAWYEWFFIDTRSEKVSCDGSGKPILTLPPKVIFQELPPVEQNEVYKGLSFDYDVQVWANCEDRIELQVRNYNTSTSPDGWDKLWLKNYTELDLYTNKTLTWYAVNLTLDNFRNGQGLYKVVGNTSESQPYSGPKIEERFDDPRVSYKKTINELLSFDYEVTAWVNWAKSSIRLEVYNYHLHEWEEKGIRNYATPGKYQKLRWESIILSSDYFKKDTLDTLSGKYRFVGSYNKDKLEIIGPTIEEKFYPLDVAPTQGTNTDTFNYSVTVNANICDKIELQVKNHTTTTNNNDIKWDSKGTRDYVTPNINKTLTWNNIKLNTHELDQFNDSMFRFYGTKVGINSSTSTGPFYPLDLSWRNPSVRPNEGLYLYDSKFDYCIEVKSTKEIDVKLRVYYPRGGEAVIADNRKSYTRGDRGNWKLICWNDTQPFVDEDEGDAKYKFEFYYTKTKINETERSGPSIGIAIFKDASLEPEIGTRETEFTFSVWVMAAKPDYLTLKVYDSNGDCVAERKSKDKTTAEWKQFVFENVPFKVPPALGNASYEFLTGKGTKISFDGPELIEEEFGELIVKPKEGTCSTPFNFSIDFSTSKPGNVPVTLQVSLDEAADDADWEDVVTKRYENDIPGSQIPVNFTVCMAENEVTENLASAWVNNKVIFWRVKGQVNKSIPIPTTYDIDLKWYNPSVSEEEGRWYDPFSFNVSLSAIENGTVALQVKLNGSDSDWQNRGKTYNYARSDNKSFTWLNEPICSDSFAGNTWYRFEFRCGEAPYYSNKSGLDGPKLFIPLNISFTDGCVEEKEDVIFSKTFGGLFNETSNTFFNFSIKVTANDTTDVDLILVDPNNNPHPERDSKSYTEPPQQLPFTWTQKELPLAEIGNWRYTFSYNDPRNGSMRCNELFEGPKIIAVFKNYTIEPYPILFNRTHKVTVLVTGTIPMEIELEAFNLYQNKRIWESVGTTKDYEPPGEQLLNWTINTFDMPFDNLRLNCKVKENGE